MLADEGAPGKLDPDVFAVCLNRVSCVIIIMRATTCWSMLWPCWDAEKMTGKEEAKSGRSSTEVGSTRLGPVAPYRPTNRDAMVGVFVGKGVVEATDREGERSRQDMMLGDER